MSRFSYNHWSPSDLGEEEEPALDAPVHHVGLGAAGADGLTNGGVDRLEGVAAFVRRLHVVAHATGATVVKGCVIMVKIVTQSNFQFLSIRLLIMLKYWSLFVIVLNSQSFPGVESEREARQHVTSSEMI